MVCAEANFALERARLQAELASRVEELAGSRQRLVEAGDAARRQIERDLHDGAAAAGVARHRRPDDRGPDPRRPDTAASLVAAARKEVTESLAELRELARGIHPHVLEHDGVGGADGSGLRGLADRVETLGGSLGVAGPAGPAGAGTVLTARLPCAVRPAAR